MRFSLLPRKKDTDKRAYGHVLVVAGSRSYPGAAILTATAALRAGAGLVTLAGPQSMRPALFKRFPAEIMPVFLPETPQGSLSERAFTLIKKLVRERGINAVALGPGLTHEHSTSSLVRKLVAALDVAIVLDADGLNAFKGHAQALQKHRASLVLTPHAGEFERVFGRARPPSPRERALLAKRLSKLYDGVLVLKGHRTLVAWRDKIFWNTTGNPGMAKGGSGDVLTGILAAFIAQGLDPFQASVWAVYFHGRAGDLAVRQTGELSLTASDLIDFLPKVFAGKRSLE